jgi:hypothetical protein
MAGVYAFGEFKDNFGGEWKAEIYDTTYSGFASEFQFAENGFEIEYDGITEKPLLTPFFKTSATVKIQVKETDTAIQALINDLPNGLEDQYYLLIYKKVAGNYRKWWCGMILTDICEYDDMTRFVFNISAKDGLNRLENFDYPIADILNPKVNEILAIKYALQICGLERFYSTGEPYIATSLNWWEVNADRTKVSMFYTRLFKTSFIEDVKEQRPFRALQAIENILLTYGACLRFEEGMWRITQIETQNAANISWEYYDKAGNYVSSAIGGNESTIYSNDNNTLSVITNTYLPSIYRIEETQEGISSYVYGLNETVTGPPYRLAETIPCTTPHTYILTIQYGFNAPARGGLLRLSFAILRNGYIYVEANSAGAAFPWGTRGWVLGSVVPAGYQLPFTDLQATANAYASSSVAMFIPPPPGAAAGQNMQVDITGNREWISTQVELRDYQVAFTPPDFTRTYEALNTTYNAASISHEEKLYYCDSDLEFVKTAKEVFDGSVWVKSEEWASGAIATSGVPFAQLICQKALYFQRKPRLMFQGSLKLPAYASIRNVVWRSKRFIFMGGTFDAQTFTWTGIWCQLLEQTSGTSSGIRNPYRDIFKELKDDVYENRQYIETTSEVVQKHNTDIFNLNRIVVWDSDANYSLEPEQTNLTFTNIGQATATTMVYTLPVIEVGLKYNFSNHDGAKTIQIDAQSGDTIIFANQTGDTLKSSKIAFLTLAAIDTNTWQVMYCDKHNDWSLT